MRRELFVNANMGDLVEISGVDHAGRAWTHVAFVPVMLPAEEPALAGATYRTVANARAALASMDALARQLPEPALLRQPALRREAQSTSALEGTYAPLLEVLSADEAGEGLAGDVREVLNYVIAANRAFDWVGDGRPLTVGLLTEVQRTLMRHTAQDGPKSGVIRQIQVAIGAGARQSVQRARFVPQPPGTALEGSVQDLVDWLASGNADRIDPVVGAAMAHYQFETLHPFVDGNGRIGRLLVVLQLLGRGAISEPTLTVSPWFEARRQEYYDRLLAVSTTGDWDGWVRFFAAGMEASADTTHRQMKRLLGAQTAMREQVRRSNLRADTAMRLVDYAIGNPTFSVKRAAAGLGVSVPRANTLIGRLTELGLLAQIDTGSNYGRRFYAPEVIQVLLDTSDES